VHNVEFPLPSWPATPGPNAGAAPQRASEDLRDVFRAVSVEDAVFFELAVGGPRSAQPEPLRPRTDRGSVLHVYVMVTGSCRATMAAEPAQVLEAGDVLLLRGTETNFEAPSAGAELIAGVLICAATTIEPLLQTLPRVIHLPRAPDARFEALARLAVHESSARSAGGACALSCLSELFVIDVVRRYWAASPPTEPAWLGLRHDSVRRVLTQIHDRPAHDWSLEELARAGGMSRSVLSERFTEALGVPPMQYVSQRRMRLAAGLLASTSLSLAEIATRVGYGSEAALSRAYKRCVGVPPAEWRRGSRAGQELRPVA